MYIVASQRGISPIANISAPCVYKRAWHASVGYAKRIQELGSWATSHRALHIWCKLLHHKLKMYIVASQRGISPTVNISTPCVYRRAWHASVGYAKRIQELRSWATSHRSLHRYNARCCIISMQRYRSGHNGADSKSVCAKSTRGFESLPLRQRFNLTHSGLIEPFSLGRDSKGNRYRADFRWTSATEEDRARSSRENRIPPSAPINKRSVFSTVYLFSQSVGLERCSQSERGFAFEPKSA